MAMVRSRLEYFLRPEQHYFRYKLNLLRSVTMIGRAPLEESRYGFWLAKPLNGGIIRFRDHSGSSSGGDRPGEFYTGIAINILLKKSCIVKVNRNHYVIMWALHMLSITDKIVLTDRGPVINGQTVEHRMDSKSLKTVNNIYLSDISGPVDFGMAKTLYRWSNIYNLQVD